MKVYLPGHEGTKKILPASSWLADKYLPPRFEIYWLNYGEYEGQLFSGDYVNMAKRQQGGVDSWAHYLVHQIEKVSDKYVILGLDDYLINKRLDMNMYDLLKKHMGGRNICGRLSSSAQYEGKIVRGHLVRLFRTNFTCTAQWCMWNREALLMILNKVTNPWDFEVRGTAIMNSLNLRTIGTSPHILDYPDHSALSPKWDGIHVSDNNYADIKILKENGHI